MPSQLTWCEVVSVALDGTGEMVVPATGDFYGHPRVSPDGKLAYWLGHRRCHGTQLSFA